MIEVRVLPGKKTVAYTSSFPSRRYWFRHDVVNIGGVTLNGHIQVRFRHGRMDTLTSFGNSCVLGTNVDWLARQNGLTTPLKSR